MTRFPSFLRMNNVPLCVYVCMYVFKHTHNFFNHSPVRQLDYLCILAIVNGAVNVRIQVVILFPLYKYQK
jgi:hypothetical protein